MELTQWCVHRSPVKIHQSNLTLLFSRWKGLGSITGKSIHSSRMVQHSSAVFQQGQQTQILNQMQSAGLSPDRRREHRDSERRRASQGGNNIAPPSPALVRHGSKQRKIPTALTPGGNNTGQITPHSAAAQVNIPVGSGRGAQHPYANVSGAGYDYGREADEGYMGQYGRASPMLSSVGAAPPVVSNARARGGDVGVSGEYGQEADEPPRKMSLLKILTCRCG